MQRKTSWGLGRGHCPSPEDFSTLSLKIATFSAFWALAHVAGRACPLDPPVDEGGRARVTTDEERELRGR